MKQFEYKVIHYIDVKLTTLGLEGWELVTIDDNYYYFKRVISKIKKK